MTTSSTVGTRNTTLTLLLTLGVLATTARAFAPLSPVSFKIQTDTNNNNNVYSRHYYPTTVNQANERRNKMLGLLASMKSPETSVDEATTSSKTSNTPVKILSEEQQETTTLTTKDEKAINNEKECAISPEPEEELSETKKLLKQVKEAGTAGVISYALWELGFWALSVPVCISAYYGLFGHFPDLTNKEDLSKLGGEAFAFVNFARFAVPLRIGLALSTTPWIQKNVVDKFFTKKDKDANGDGENCQEEQS